jgi:hypothetical protein
MSGPEVVVGRVPEGGVSPLDADHSSPPWSTAEGVSLGHAMGEAPEHRPAVSTKLLYDEKYLYLSFLVEDRYVIATARRHQDPVCIDSCVEFFFTPGVELEEGYFNVEVNCGGTVLLHHQLERGKSQIAFPDESIDRMEVRHSLPRLVSPEIVEPVTWTVRYRLAFDDLESIAPVRRPGPGVVWRGNFYKCADRCSHPHWLTWAKVDRIAPDFHRKEYFGRIVFG